jgi:hypothetical protein
MQRSKRGCALTSFKSILYQSGYLRNLLRPTYQAIGFVINEQTTGAWMHRSSVGKSIRSGRRPEKRGSYSGCAECVGVDPLYFGLWHI